MMVLNIRDHILVKKYNGYGSFAHNDGAGKVRIDWDSKDIIPEFIRERNEVIRPYKVAAWILSAILVVDLVAIVVFGT
jgi:hypothetical protein